MGSLGIEVLLISVSKGLEFDYVLIYKRSEENYNSQRDWKILYTAISRAMKQVFVTYEKKLTRLLFQGIHNSRKPKNLSIYTDRKSW